MGTYSCGTEVGERHLSFQILAGTFRQALKLPSRTHGHGLDDARQLRDGTRIGIMGFPSFSGVTSGCLVPLDDLFCYIYIYFVIDFL